MRELLFLDTEFTALRQNTQLISLALVSADRSFYAEFNDYPDIDLTDWHQEHVISNLLFNEQETHKDCEGAHWRIKNNTTEITLQLRAFLQSFSEMKIWADVLAYDWILFCELFGGALYLPDSIFYIPGDISTLLQLKGYDANVSRASLLSAQQLRALKERGLVQHNALYDAHVVQTIYQQLI